MPLREESFKVKLKQIDGLTISLSSLLKPHIVRSVFQEIDKNHSIVRVILNEGDDLLRQQIAEALEKIGFTLITEVAAAS